MPELPEVETVVRGLQHLVLGREIHHVKVKRFRIIRPEKPRTFEKQLSGRIIQKVERYGKWIAFRLSGDLTLWSHLGMTGQFRWNDPDKYVRVIIQLNGQTALYFSDIRLFGRMLIDPNNEPTPPGVPLGLDPILHKVSGKYLYDQFRSRKIAIKDILLNQEIVAGIGNIYASEILFDANLHPLRPADSLTLKECRTLAKSIGLILRQAIDWCGTTLSDARYQTLDGSSGDFQDFLKVYGRVTLPCLICNTPLERYVLHGRSGVFCPQCQRQLPPLKGGNIRGVNGISPLLCGGELKGGCL